MMIRKIQSHVRELNKFGPLNSQWREEWFVVTVYWFLFIPIYKTKEVSRPWRSHKAGLLASEEAKGGRGLEYEWNKFHETQNRPDEEATLDDETITEWKNI